jgi:hypothetical protein
VSAWVRRHRWGLIALAVLLPAAVLASLSVSWFGYYETQAQHPVVVESGSPATIETIRFDSEGTATAELSLDSYTVVPADTEAGREVGLLPGSEAVSAVIHVDATGAPEDAASCDAILVAPGPEGERIWRIAGGGDIDYYPSGDLESFCSLNNGVAFDWEAVFVVPEGVGDDATLYIVTTDLVPRRILQLEH